MVTACRCSVRVWSVSGYEHEHKRTLTTHPLTHSLTAPTHSFIVRTPSLCRSLFVRRSFVVRCRSAIVGLIVGSIVGWNSVAQDEQRSFVAAGWYLTVVDSATMQVAVRG